MGMGSKPSQALYGVAGLWMFCWVVWVKISTDLWLNRSLAKQVDLGSIPDHPKHYSLLGLKLVRKLETCQSKIEPCQRTQIGKTRSCTAWSANTWLTGSNKDSLGPGPRLVQVPRGAICRRFFSSHVWEMKIFSLKRSRLKKNRVSNLFSFVIFHLRGFLHRLVL